jgi:hypothetical protein
MILVFCGNAVIKSERKQGERVEGEEMHSVQAEE